MGHGAATATHTTRRCMIRDINDDTRVGQYVESILQRVFLIFKEIKIEWDAHDAQNQ